MTIKQLILIIPRMMRYNMKIIFAGKFFWFLLAAFGFYAYFLFHSAWERMAVNDGEIYDMLLFPSLLLIFYPTVFGIQNDEDSRILEIIFGIPNYRYKVWGVRLLMIYVIVFVILLVFAFIGTVMLYPVSEIQMATQLMFPVLFFGNMAFMFSTITRSGNGTAVVMIILGIVLMMFTGSGSLWSSFWNVFLNPFNPPRGFHPLIWEGVVLKSRMFLSVAALVWLLIGLLRLQKREKFV